MSHEHKKTLSGFTGDSLTTNHIEQKIQETVDYAETTRHIEIRLNRLATEPTDTVRSASSELKNAGKTNGRG